MTNGAQVGEVVSPNEDAEGTAIPGEVQISSKTRRDELPEQARRPSAASSKPSRAAGGRPEDEAVGAVDGSGTWRNLALVPYSAPMMPSGVEGPRSPLLPRKRPFAVRDCPPGMRIRGGRPARAVQRKPAAPSRPIPPEGKQEKPISGNRKSDSVLRTGQSSGSRPEPDIGPTGTGHERKRSLGAPSSRPAKKPKGEDNSPNIAAPIRRPRKPVAANAGQPGPAIPNLAPGLAPELISEDVRVRVKFLIHEFDNLRRRFLAEEDGRPKKAGKPCRPDLGAWRILEPYQLHSESVYGRVPGVEVGDHYYYRMEMFMISLHRQPQGGIDYITEAKSQFKNGEGQPVSIAVSVISSGGYEENQDMGNTLLYTGQGGNNDKGNKLQSEDQDLLRGNLALKNSCDFNLAVRVIRGREFKKAQGLSNPSPSGKIYYYDGLYDVVDCFQERGVSGYKVWKFKLVRQPNQGPLSAQVLLYKGGVLPPALRARGERIIHEDIALGLEPIKIRVVGREDGDRAPTDFTYISALRFAPGVPKPFSGLSGQWCNCSGNQCSSAESRCSCMALNGGPAYNDEGGLLWAKRLVYECGSRCRCGTKCVNRVVQKGPQYDMEVFRTNSTGWGVRSRTFIPQGSFICEYIGEVIHASEAEKRVAQDEYLFDLKIPDSMERRFGHESGLVRTAASDRDNVEGKEDESKPAQFTLDARQYGNVARFINHSCEPNLFVQCVLYDHHDYLFPHITLFSLDHIAPYKELTYDYGYEYNNITHANGNIKAKVCSCLAQDCRGRLY